PERHHLKMSAAQPRTMQHSPHHPRLHTPVCRPSMRETLPVSGHVASSATAGEIMKIRWLGILARWSLGVVLVSWRYLWSTIPLHRSIEPGDITDLPPALPDQLVDDRSQPMAAGVGPLFRRLFAVTIADPTVSAVTLIANITVDLNQGVPSEVTLV